MLYTFVKNNFVLFSVNYGLIDLNSTINNDTTDNQGSTLTIQELLKKVNHFNGLVFVIVGMCAQGLTHYQAQASDATSKTGADVFCKLGHLHLLLGEYSDGNLFYFTHHSY